MDKPPICILQAMMDKMGVVPKFELIQEGTGLRTKPFAFQVFCGGFTATGTGLRKKDAKHKAAAAMLEKIAEYRGFPQLPTLPARSSVIPPLPMQIPSCSKTPSDVPFINAVSALQDLCVQNDMQEAEYQVISDIGPPHARIFTVQCTMVVFKEAGIATTKKQAKYKAAKKVLDKIMDILSKSKSLGGTCHCLQKEKSRRKEVIANEIAIACFIDRDFGGLPTTRKSSEIKVSEHHRNLKKAFEETECNDVIRKVNSMLIEIIECIESRNFSEFESKIKIQFQEFLLTTLNAKVKKVLLRAEVNMCVVLISMQLGTCPDITEISFGETETEAEMSATLRILQTLKLLIAFDILPMINDSF